MYNIQYIIIFMYSLNLMDIIEREKKKKLVHVQKEILSLSLQDEVSLGRIQLIYVRNEVEML